MEEWRIRWLPDAPLGLLLKDSIGLLSFAVAFSQVDIDVKVVQYNH